MNPMPKSSQPKTNEGSNSKRSPWIRLACFSIWLGALLAAAAAIATLNVPTLTMVRYGAGFLLFAVSALLVTAGWGMWRLRPWGAILYLGIGLAFFLVGGAYRVTQWDRTEYTGGVEMVIDIIGLAMLLGSSLLIFSGAWKGVTRK